MSASYATRTVLYPAGVVEGATPLLGISQKSLDFSAIAAA